MSENERCKKALAKTIVKLRRRQNVKRHYLAVQLGVSVAAIDKMEQAVTHPNFGQVFLLTKALGTTMHEFADAFEQELVNLTPPFAHPLKGK